MNVDLTDHELEVIVRALEEHRTRRQGDGLSTADASELLEKLSQHRRPREAGSEGPQPA